MQQSFPNLLGGEADPVKSQTLTFYSTFSLSFKTLFRPDVIFVIVKRLEFGYWRYLQHLKQLAVSFEFVNDETMSLIFDFCNILHSVFHTMLSG